ncbi:hypothetical protein IWW34DRAFT_870958 [Fusarium oxysporum f. sp. albedinis]|nr:hypothetical protein IWW34DRAFT_870958 [Fusarium oxysporum f. sp. albedinis]KAK2473553.1 hypothetical protein H9L39_15728 [Fusarium oxysporum f. sp. albedinis]
MLFNKNILTILAATAMAVSANPCSSDQTLVCCKKVGPNSKCQTLLGIPVLNGNCLQIGGSAACCQQKAAPGSINLQACVPV